MSSERANALLVRGAFLCGALLLGACGEAPPTAPRIPPTPPKAQETPPPAYPEALACEGVGGEVILMLQIGANGIPADVRVQKRSRHPALDASAVEAVRAWRFVPATAAGKPVATKIQVPVTFTPPPVKPESCFAFEERQRRASQG